MGFCFLYRECSSSASKNKSLAVSEIVPGTTSPGDINFPVVLKVVNSEARENQSNQSIRRSTCSFTFNRLRQITLILQPFFYLCLVNKFSNHSPGLMRSICCHLKLKERNNLINFLFNHFMRQILQKVILFLHALLLISVPSQCCQNVTFPIRILDKSPPPPRVVFPRIQLPKHFPKHPFMAFLMSKWLFYFWCCEVQGPVGPESIFSILSSARDASTYSRRLEEAISCSDNWSSAFLLANCSFASPWKLPKIT